jgi:hypothetical protein
VAFALAFGTSLPKGRYPDLMPLYAPGSRPCGWSKPLPIKTGKLTSGINRLNYLAAAANHRQEHHGALSNL